jgi:RNA polymerase sigma-70 factor (ECF subfamily)
MSSGEITTWLERLRAGDDAALDRVVPLLYEELRAVARRLLRRERPEHTLSTTALVHEAYLRLVEARRLSSADRGAFLAAAAVTMRRLLVDAARRRQADKRGGGALLEPLDEELAEGLRAPAADAELLALDAALERLGAASPRARQVVELRFFAGLSLEETAEALETSVKTIQRDWLAARAWLRAEIDPSALPDP